MAKLQVKPIDEELYKANEQFLALCGSWDDERSALDMAEQLRNDRQSRGRRDIEF